VVGAVFPLGEALRANRRLRSRRPEIGDPNVPLREDDVGYWRGELQGSPTLGTVVDQVYEEQRGRGETATLTAQVAVATAAIVVSMLGVMIALPAIGQMFDVSLWFLVAAAFAFIALLAAARAVRLARFPSIDLESILDPIERGKSARGEASRDVFLIEVRARRAAAVLRNRAVAEAVANLVTASWASLRNAFVAILIWLVVDVAPDAIAATARSLGLD
jgi:hypothetical protein